MTQTVRFPMAIKTVRPNVPGAGSRRRWAILRDQMQVSSEPCFGTDYRYFCDDFECPLRRECVALRARHHLS